MSRPCPNALPLLVAAVILALVPAGCALVTCRPVTIVAAEKKERAHLEIVPTGLRTTETGRLEAVEQFRVVHAYWLRSEENRWYTVSVTDFRAAQVGRPIEVCR